MAIAFRSVGAVGTGTNPTAGVPGTSSVGDLFVLVTTGTAAPTAPAGWTLVYAQGVGRFLTVYYKICSSNESNLTLTQTGASSKAVILCYSGSGNYDVVGTVNTGTSASPATLSQTTKSANDFVMSIYAVISGAASTLTTNASTNSRITSAATGTSNGLLVADETKATAGATTVRTASQTSSTSAWAAIAISIREKQTLYWTGTGNWNSTSLWRTSSGGATQANPPGQGDDVVIDGNSTSLTISTAAICNNLYVSTATFTGTLAGTSTLTIYGSLTCDAGNAGGTYSYSGDITFAAVTGSGNKTIDTYDQSFFNKNNITFNGVGGIWLLASDLGDPSLTANKTLTLTAGGFSLQNHTCWFNAFSASGTTARTLDFSGAGTIQVFGTNKTVIDIGTTTNLTILGAGNYISSPSATSAGTRTITLGNIYTIANAPYLSVATDVGDTVSITATSVQDLYFGVYYIYGASVTTISNTTLTIFGSLYLPVSGTSFTSGTNAWTFAAITLAYFYLNNNTLNIPLIFNGVGGNWTIFGSLTTGSTRSITLTNGTIDLNGYSLTCGTFSSSNANLREIKRGDVYVLSNATTIWDTTTSTNLAVTNVNLYSTYAGATGTRTIVTPATQTAVPSVIINAGTDIVSLTSAYNVELTGFGGTLSNITRSVFGYFITSSSGTFSMTAGTNITSFRATSGVYIIISNNKLFDFPLIFDGIGGGWILQDALTVGSTRPVTLTNGSLNLNNNNLTCGYFSSINTNTRSIAFGTGQFYVTGSNGGVWRTDDGTGMTITGTSPTVNATYSGATGTRSIINTSGSGTYATAVNLNVTAGTDIITASGNPGMYNNVSFTGFSGSSTWFGNILGNLVFSSTMTQVTSSSINVFNHTGTQNITSNGITVDSPMTIGQRNTITGASGDGTTVTVTFGSSINFVYPVGSTVEVYGVIPTQYNGTYTVTASTLTSLSYANTTTATYTSAGSVYSGSTVTLIGALTVGLTRTMTFNRGTFNLNNNNVTTGFFNSNQPGTRTLAFGTGQFFLTGNNATIWNSNLITNCNITGSRIINATYSGSVGTRTFFNGSTAGGSESTSFILNVTAGSDLLNIGNPFYSKGYNFTGFSGTLGTATVDYYVYGDVTFSPTMSLFAGSGWSIFPSNSTANVTSNGITIDANIVCGSLSPATPNCVVNFVDALTLGSTRIFSIANGTVKFPAGATSTIGALITQGTAMKYIRSTVPGTRAFLSDASGTNYVSYLNVQDSYATGGGIFDAINPTNVDSGNNLGWGFSSSNPFVFFY